MPARPSSGHPGQPSRQVEPRYHRVLFGSRAPVSSTSRSRSPCRPFVMQSVDAGIREAIEEYIRTGWSLILPPGAIVLLGAVAQLEARQQIGTFTAALPLVMQAGALAAPAWEPLSDADRADEATMALRRRHEAVSSRIAGQAPLLPPKHSG